MIHRAIILAGGKGTRLRPYTVTIPKPLVPVGDRPILEIVISQLKNYEIKHITLAVNHQADLIKAYFGDGEKWGIKIDYSLEDAPLSTIAPISLIQDLPENFIIMNGDILTDINYSALIDYHIKKEAVFTIASMQRRQLIDFGVLHVDERQSLVGFEEKPEIPFDVSMGLYVASKRILSLIPEGVPYGFDNLVIDLMQEQHLISIFPHNGYWLDIGRPDDYERACVDIESGNF